MSTEFQWTDELIQEYAEYYRFSSSRTTLEQFKASKQPKPEWEIVSLKDTYYNQIITAQNKLGIYRLEDYLVKYPKDRFKIYSVKRLSDGEVFSLGDEVTYLPVKKFSWTIDNFFIKEVNIMTVRSKDNNNVEYLNENLGKIKPALFTTEDGVKIYYGDTYYHVNARFGVDEYGAYFEQTGLDGTCCFSTKEKAEAFRIMNQPLFSISDIHDEYKLSLTSIERWIQKAKDKINPTT